MAGGLSAALTLTWPFEGGRGYLEILCLAGLACLLIALRGWPAGAGWAAGLLGAAFVLRARLDPDATGWTPLVAGLLLLVTELAFWSYELEMAPFAAGRAVRRLGLLLIVSSGAAACVALVQLLAAGLATAGAGYALLAAGVVAVVVCVLLLTLMTRSAAGRAT